MPLDILQEPKYDTNSAGRLVNRATGKPIPDFEPVLVFRAQDSKAVHALTAYRDTCNDKAHRAVIQRRINEFKLFAEAFPERMKEPDSAIAVINLQSCESTNVSAHGYDKATQTLAIQFRGGPVYHYLNVPIEIYAEMTGASSIGSFVAKQVRSVFDSVRIDDNLTETAAA